MSAWVASRLGNAKTKVTTTAVMSTLVHTHAAHLCDLRWWCFL